MADRFAGRVAFITGAARGQGRAHAVRFAEEGADILAVDLCRQMPSVAYPMATPEDLAETVELVHKTGRRIVAVHADVRDPGQLQAAVQRCVAELGRIDFVLANAGILPVAGEQGAALDAFVDAIDVMLKGVYFTITAALPALLAHGDGGAVVITGSAASFKPVSVDFASMTHGAAGYTIAKHGVIGVMRHFAVTLAEKNIRVNSIHPGGVATPMVHNEALAGWAADHPAFSAAQRPLLDTPPVEPDAISEALVYLCSDAGRYITGVALPVDGGQIVK
ncbi:putative short-chain type dehydrogenase/reductase [Mycolicibacterium hassiacum DSM 44199]|jgi:SDR family mycofactocin-dependent oxidoreductase|uniref:Putative short-chain type dehydrogenase/reductase n=1 Tax=Mycolicibacterium hassiacum (strain DSM 44199 / CIP 105218 / JCM 12690 / 3849) TaxID=1122247 RepID=K5BK50_MYCHD|nr:mycofactocin-coupled SDR family oxidoreductase [Mycolicibacterium hassiacum]EKF24249.1 putative short-chain type dehydrogenase/reductase [Mycolicibacterium hassiacum DSM 44199]MBX5485337.1 mycofactocin-coupled SDR family oxidoreductase [Mycolicibacterium hassiacum]MDA4086310.1 3-ketoacyl-ACP reductase [Mycolicibacterium hassiacum DSM 44199]PZN22285.1 MAG: NAD(P)-dependent oxidoreductase [Mycolicibacterium hassiacum]VCT90797.1 putative oxidoreductase [Mycolicibacterium hassiacum DSM 44199]